MAAVRLESIISDCALGCASRKYWNQHCIDWAEIIATGYKRGSIGVLIEQMSYAHYDPDRFQMLQDIICQMYSDVMIWFFRDHSGDYLGSIGADVRGVILHYMCRRVELGAAKADRLYRNTDSICEIKVYLFDVVHSVCGRPSMIYVRKSEMTYSWHIRGLRLRGALPQAVTKRSNGEVVFHFAETGRSLCLNASRTAARQNSGPWTTDPKLMAEALELLRLHEE